MKSITCIRPTRDISDQAAQNVGFDPEAAFADPVGYLASLGIDSRLVGPAAPVGVQEAA